MPQAWNAQAWVLAKMTRFFCPYECAHPLKMNGSNPKFGDLEDDLPLQIGDFYVPALVAFGRVHGVD